MQEPDETDHSEGYQQPVEELQEPELQQQDEFEQSPDQMKLPGKEMKVKRPRFSANKKLPNVKKMIVAVLVVLILGGGGFAVWKYAINKEDTGVATIEPDQQNQQATTTDQVETSPLSETYSSADLRIDFKYPADWQVTEGAGGIRVESAEFTYTTADGSDTSGNFRIYLRKGAREVDSKFIGRGVAISSSEDLTYSDPVPGQRKDTYLSSFGLDTTDNFNFFMVAGNFNLKKGDTLGPGYGKEASAYIVAGGYSGNDLSEDMQMNSVPIDSYQQTSAYKEAMEIIKSLQLK